MSKISNFSAKRTKSITESMIRKMTREALDHGAINLSQGFPDEDMTPERVKKAAKEYIDQDNQYSITWGMQDLREKVSEKYNEWRDLEYDPETEVTVTCGTSEAVMATILSLISKDDGVMYFEPSYENYIPSTQIAKGNQNPVYIDTDLNIKKEELKVKSRDSSVLILNTPHNPSGKVFTQDELKFIRDIAIDNDLIIVSDEIYEHMVYDGDHISPAQIDGLKERTVLCSGISKTYSVTGWRIGYLMAPKYLSKEIRKIHDYTSICAPTPFQKASIAALDLSNSYYEEMRNSYRKRRDLMVEGLNKLGFDPVIPQGSYYIMASFDDFETVETDQEFSLRLIEDTKVASVPGSSFYTDKNSCSWIRFTFSRSESTLKKALKNIEKNKWW